MVSLSFESVSRSPATSVMELFPPFVNNFLLITDVARTSILDFAVAVDQPLLLQVLFFRVIFLKILVSEFVLTIRLLWQCTFNSAKKLLFNESLYISHLNMSIYTRVFLLSYLNCHGKIERTLT